MGSKKNAHSAFGRETALTRRSLLASAAGLAVASGFSGVGHAQGKAINIGAILPLSGANAQFGINSRNAIELVVDEINAAGGIKALGGAKFNLIVADSTSTPTTAASVAQRLVSQNEIVAAFGCFASALTLAVSEVTERAGIPLFTQSFSDQLTGRGFENIFQIVAKGSVLGKAQLDGCIEIAKANGQKLERIAIMFEDTAYGTSQAGGLRAGAKAAGIQVVMDEGYPLGITDVTPLINKLRASNAQAVFPVSYLNDSLQIVRGMRQQKLEIPTIGGAAGYIIPDFEKGLGPFAENVLSISPATYDLAPEFTERFRKRFGYFMVHEAVEFAAAVDVLAQALEMTKSTDLDALRKVLHGTKFTGGWTKAMTGSAVEFDKTGLNILSVPVMVQWRGKDLVTVWPDSFAKSKPVWKL
ncbi:branched-chain amino acid transport system substrate-binding protein [Nitrobacteraceae bacterium AZCC 1564]